jgi:hypothetical protein
MILRTFRWAGVVTVVGLVLAWVYGGTEALAIAAILAVLEISLSFDNAVVNATVLHRMSEFWQRMFLTLGVVIAVFGMRLLFPLIIVAATAHLSPGAAVQLALNDGNRYGELLRDAHPAIAAFGGMFLLMLFLDFVFEAREFVWLDWLERPLARIGKLDQLSVVIALLALIGAAKVLAPEGKDITVVVSGVLGLVTYVLVNGLGELFESQEEESFSDEETVQSGANEPAGRTAGSETWKTIIQVGKAAFFLFLYLEVLDASFSFDGVIGAFAITSDPIIIAIGLGIGAMYIRSLTVFLVRKGTLAEYIYLEHGAHWAIGALAALLILTIRFAVPEIVTGLIGVAFIGAALMSSIARNRRVARTRDDGHPEPEDVVDVEMIA